MRDRSPSYCPWSCGHGDVALVEDDEEVLREVVEQRVRRLARGATVEVARVVLDPRARPDLAHHLEVVRGAHAEALRLEQLAAVLEPLEPVDQLDLDVLDRPPERFLLGHVVRRREEDERVVVLHQLAGDRVHPGDALDLVAEELDADAALLVGREDLDRVAADAELVADERHVVALVLQLDEALEDGPLVVLLADVEGQELGGVGLRRAEAVDRGHAGDDDDVAPAEECAGGAVAQPVDLVVDRAVLLDVRVARRHVRLGLVVVVVADEVLDPVLGEELAELRRQLRGEALVRRQDQRGPLHLGDEARDREGLAGPGDAQERLVLLPRLDARGQLLDRLRLVSRRLEVRHQLEIRHEVTLRPGCDIHSCPASDFVHVAHRSGGSRAQGRGRSGARCHSGLRYGPRP